MADFYQPVQTNSTVELIKAIDAELLRLSEMFQQCGEWTGEEYMEMIRPLHEAYLSLAKGEEIELPTSETSDPTIPDCDDQ